MWLNHWSTVFVPSGNHRRNCSGLWFWMGLYVNIYCNTSYILNHFSPENEYTVCFHLISFWIRECNPHATVVLYLLPTYENNSHRRWYITAWVMKSFNNARCFKTGNYSVRLKTTTRKDQKMQFMTHLFENTLYQSVFSE